ncbi:hypothetical protein IWQ61_004369 [Dispira simplex]|nr:hypothetical protein IWQ61_004369 [Dispira simplex]
MPAGGSPLSSFNRLTTQDVPPPTPPRPQVTPVTPGGPQIISIHEGETVHHRLLLVYGRAGQPDTRFEGELFYYPQNFPTQRCLVVDTHFKSLVPLEPGQNLIRFHYGGQDTYLTVYYTPLLQNPPLRLAIMVAKDSPLTFDAPPDKRGPGKNDLAAAVVKLRCTAYLWQAFTSEQMYRNGFGRRTFRLEEEWQPDTLTNQESVPRNTAKVYIVRSRLTLAEIRDPLRAQQYKPPDGQKSKDNMFNVFSQAAEDYRAPFDQTCYVAALILDSHWDTKLHTITAHAALGGGIKHRQQAVFGSHCTHAWPSALEDMTSCFLDNTATDESILANDAGDCGTYYKTANIGMGAFLHEVGHLLTLAHTPSGIMRRGFRNYNRTFMVKEPGFAPITPGDEGESYWHRTDIIRLLFHPCLRLPTDPPALPPALSKAASSFYAVDKGILVTNEAGIASLEIWVKNQLVGHLEYYKTYTRPLTQVVVTIEELRRHATWKAGDKVCLTAFAVSQSRDNIEDLDRFESQHRVSLPHDHGSITAFKSDAFGDGRMQGTKPFQVFFSSGPAPSFHGRFSRLLSSFQDKQALPPITHIRIYRGGFVDGFIVYLADGRSVQCGNAKGDPLIFHFQSGEQLAYINVRSGAWIDSLEFVTTTGRTTGWCGGSKNGGLHKLCPPAGYDWAGLYGSAARWLDSLGCFYCRKQVG